MRNLGAVLLLLVTAFFAMTAPSLAQSTLRQCAGVDLTGPADGAVLDPGYRANFTWDSEPRGTASREWVSVRVDLDETSFSFEDAKRAKAEPRLYKGFARGRPGVYAWAVIFYDAKGNPICQSEAQTYVVVGGGFDSLSGAGSPAAIAAVKAALGRYVVRLTGFDAADIAYNGPVNQDVKGFVYIDSLNPVDWQALGYEGLDVHGTNHNGFIIQGDLIIGSDKGDRIYGYAGDDAIYGLDGDDEIHGGNESCAAGNYSYCSVGDYIEGNDGNDTISGGDESCTYSAKHSGCSAGDDIKGGDGNDTINGDAGNDDIEGNDGDDTINGGDNWDDLQGNAGNDIIHGNDGNDDIDGNSGQDQLFGDNDDDSLDGGSGNDTLDGGPGIDTGTGGGGSDTCSNGGFSSCP